MHELVKLPEMHLACMHQESEYSKEAQICYRQSGNNTAYANYAEPGVLPFPSNTLPTSTSLMSDAIYHVL